mmetsp:Transcript_93827/g.214605  ORF Transcript_93827/g.214605 Transcript_93827/m.214605 type:complete len:219 (-) Transcript_93827:292-948(-)
MVRPPVDTGANEFWVATSTAPPVLAIKGVDGRHNTPTGASSGATTHSPRPRTCMVCFSTSTVQFSAAIATNARPTNWYSSRCRRTDTSSPATAPMYATTAGGTVSRRALAMRGTNVFASRGLSASILVKIATRVVKYNAVKGKNAARATAGTGNPLRYNAGGRKRYALVAKSASTTSNHWYSVWLLRSSMSITVVLSFHAFDSCVALEMWAEYRRVPL